MSEQVFLDEDEVKVTHARFMVPGQTYAMSGVTSVAFDQDNPSKKGPVIVIVIGLLLMLIGFAEDATTGIIGFFILVAGIVWFLLLKPTYYVTLHSASGESRALESKDGEWIEEVITALNDAIVARG